VERVLKDLYGDLERTELDTLLSAIHEVVMRVMRFVRPELAAEYEDATRIIDYRCLPANMRQEGEGVSGSEAGAAKPLARGLAVRALQVSIDPKRYCPYTIKFITALDTGRS
jgi:hypothetical protein